MNIIVREANINDIDEIINLWVDLETYLSETLTDLNPITIPNDLNKRRSHYEYIFNSDEYNVFVMEESNNLVGFIELAINDKDFNFEIDKYGYIAYFYVKPQYREVKHTAKLFTIGEEWVKSKGIEYLCSDVDGENYNSFKVQEKFFKLKPYKIRMAKKIL